MSNEKNVARQPFSVQQSTTPFSPVGEFKLTTDKEFGKMINERLSDIFLDYEGVVFEPVGIGGEPTFSLIFNHGKYVPKTEKQTVTDEDGNEVEVEVPVEFLGVKLAVNSREYSNDIVSRIRKNDDYQKNGMKYIATDELKDYVSNLLVPALTKGGKINWGQVVVDYKESKTSMYGAYSTITYTKIMGISPKKLAFMIFGVDGDNDDKYDYQVQYKGSLNVAGFGSQHILQILRASTNEVNDLCRAMGFNFENSNINRDENKQINRTASKAATVGSTLNV